MATLALAIFLKKAKVTDDPVNTLNSGLRSLLMLMFIGIVYCQVDVYWTVNHPFSLLVAQNLCFAER